MDEFETVMKTLLKTTPASAIEGKRPRKADAKRPGRQKRGKGNGIGTVFSLSARCRTSPDP